MLRLTPLQKAHSISISEIVPCFPQVISDIISQYKVGHQSGNDALKINADREILCPSHYMVIRDALVSQECEPSIKRNIIALAITNRYCEILNRMFDEIRASGYRINLDYTDLSNLDLTGMNLSGMSAVCANFNGSKLSNLNLTNSILIGAVMIEGVVQNCDLSRSDLRAMTVVDSTLDCVTMLKVKADRMLLDNVKVNSTDMSGMDTDDAELRKILIRNTEHNLFCADRTCLSLPLNLFNKDYFRNFVEKNRMNRALKR